MKHRILQHLSRTAILLCLAPVAFASPLHWTPLNEPGPGGAITSIEVSPHDSKRILVAGDMLGAGLSVDGSKTWQPTFGFPSWELADSTWHPSDPNTVWMGTMSGPCVSHDGGVHWSVRRDGMPAPETNWGFTAPVEKVLFDPQNPRHLLAFGGSWRFWGEANGDSSDALKYGAVWDSTDGGAHWTLKTTLFPDTGGRGANIMQAGWAGGSAKIIYAAVSGHGVCKSTDRGLTWAAVNTGLPPPETWSGTRWSIAIHPTDPNVVWASVKGGGIYKTTDGGAHWLASGDGLQFGPNDEFQHITVSAADPRLLFTDNSGTVTAYRSTDGGTRWERVLDGSAVWPALTFTPAAGGGWHAVDPRNSHLVYLGGATTVFKSTASGASGTWADVMADRAAPGSSLWRGRGFGGYVSYNVMWNPYNPKQAVLSALDDGRFWTSVDGLRSWLSASGVDNWWGSTDAAFGADGKTILFAQGQFGDFHGLCKSADGGQTWAYAGRTRPPGSQGSPNSLYVHPTQTNRVWMTLGDWRGTRLYTSSDTGTTWSTLTVGEEKSCRWIVADPRAPLTLYVSGDGGVYKSTDGETFALMPGSPAGGEEARLKLDPSDPDTLYVTRHLAGAQLGGVWRFQKGQWTRLWDNNFACDVTINPKNPQMLAAVTDRNPGVEISPATGVWLSRDSGKTWHQENAGLPMLRGKCIAFSPDGTTLVVGLDGRGYFKSSITSLSSKRALRVIEVKHLRSNRRFRRS